MPARWKKPFAAVLSPRMKSAWSEFARTPAKLRMFSRKLTDGT
jgi:hypothetical protein